MMHVYCYFNNVGGFYTAPFLNNVEPEEFKKDFFMGVFNLPEKDLMTLKECDLFYLGSFDNVAGDFNIKKDFLLHVSEIVADIMAKKAGNKNGGDTEKN